MQKISTCKTKRLYCTVLYNMFRFQNVLYFVKGNFYAVKNNAMKFSSGKQLYCEIVYGEPLLNRITYISNNIKSSVIVTLKNRHSSINLTIV
jgi:hypothetical protein